MKRIAKRQVKGTKAIQYLSKSQEAWCDAYSTATSREPFMDDFHANLVTFEDAAKKSVQWFRDWAQETAARLERGMPNNLYGEKNEQ